MEFDFGFDADIPIDDVDFAFDDIEGFDVDPDVAKIDPLVDLNGDGVADVYDGELDANGDKVPDVAQQGFEDLDGDQVADRHGFLDTDGDNHNDADDAFVDTDGDMMADDLVRRQFAALRLDNPFS